MSAYQVFAIACLWLAAAALVYLAAFLRGFARGREIERMELPRRGELHFLDRSPIRPIYASSASVALDQLIASRGPRVVEVWE